MSDPIPPKRSLSDISHLFLSSVRDRQTGGTPRPKRTPPPKGDGSVDLTPEELAQVMNDPGRTEVAIPRRKPPVTAVIGAHLNGTQFDRVKQYARHLACICGRVGLIELDDSEFRVMCFEPAAGAAAAAAAAAAATDEADPVSPECHEPRQMAEALEEMNWDVDRWLVLVTNPRTPEARTLLRDANHWVLLSTCDHDGVVSSYRMLKGLAHEPHPKLSLALLDSPADADIGRVFRKLAGVCHQFLNWTLHIEEPVGDAPHVAEHLVLFCRPPRNRQQAASPQWAIASDFVRSIALPPEEPARATTESSSSSEEEAPAREMTPMEDEMTHEDDDAVRPRLVADVVLPVDGEPFQHPAVAASRRPPVQDVGPTPWTETTRPSLEPPAAPPRPAAGAANDDVMDLPDADSSAAAILAAVLRRGDGGLVECPVRAPMHVEARLAVSRERGLVMLAVARQGLDELKTIGQAYRWLLENRGLIGMAVPQFAIDPNSTPRLRLLVDQSDVSADVLRPILQSELVNVEAYRTLRWGGRTGLLLNAA